MRKTDYKVKETYYSIRLGREISKSEVTKTTEQIDSMSDESLEDLNYRLKGYTDEVLRNLANLVRDHQCFMEYCVRRYKELRKEKVEYPFWRSKGAIELVLMESGLKIKKFTQGFNIQLGDLLEDHCYLVISFDKQGDMHIEQWYRTYKKTRKLTQEEIEQREKEWIEQKKKKNEKQWKANCSKWGLTPEHFGKTYKEPENGGLYTVIGCNPRNKKFPIKCQVEQQGNTKENGVYDVSLGYFKTMGEIE